MITLAGLSELQTKVTEYEAAVTRLGRFMKLAAVVLYYDGNGHDCDRNFPAKDVEAIRDVLLQRQHHHVLNLQRALGKDGIDVAGEVERVSKIVQGYTNAAAR